MAGVLGCTTTNAFVPPGGGGGVWGLKAGVLGSTTTNAFVPPGGCCGGGRDVMVGPAGSITTNAFVPPGEGGLVAGASGSRTTNAFVPPCGDGDGEYGLVTGTSGSRTTNAFVPPCRDGVWVCAETAPAAKSQPRARLIAVRAHRVGTRRIVRRFLRDENVMRVTLLHRRAGDREEPALGPQLFDRPRAAVAHAGLEAAHELIDKRRQMPLVRHSAFDSLGHELAGGRGRLAVAIAGA